MSKSKRIFLVNLSLLVAIVSACASPDTFPPEAITVQLKWVHQGQFAGFYVAAENGFYAEEGLEVTLAPGGVGVDIMEEVLSGHAEFGLIGAEYILIHRSAGEAVKAIATTYRTNPFVLVTMPESGIRSPYDFPGHSANVGGIDGEVQFKALLSKLDLQPESVEIIPYTYDLEGLYSGAYDITPAFSAGSLIEIRKTHPGVNVIWPIDYGIHLYSDTIFTTEEMISNNPDLVLRFLHATLRGHQYALENTEAALRCSLKYADNPDATVQRAMIEASIPLVYTGYDEIGWMRAEIWEGMRAILAQQGLLVGTVTPEEAFTTQFLDEIYGGAP